jgi:polar amino acid transport system substrate-binding protein
LKRRPGRAIRLCCLAWLGSLLGCGRPDESAELPPLRWAADAEGGAPYIFKDAADPTQNIGFEVELASAVGEQLGRRIEFVQYRFEDLIPGLLRGDCDFAMNGIEVTPDRAAAVRFSTPYYVYKLQLVARADEARFDSLESCRAMGGAVGTLGGTAAERLLDDFHVEKRVYDGQVEPYRDLDLGRVDAVLLDLPIAIYYARPNAKLKFVGQPLGEGQYAVALRKEDEALARRIDAALQRLARSGELRRIYEKWRIWNDDQEGLGVRGWGVRDRGLGIGDWGLETGDQPGKPRSQHPIPNPQSPIPRPSATGHPPLATRHPSPASEQAVPNPSQQQFAFGDYLPLLLEGAWMTVLVSVCSMSVAIAIGLPIALGRRSQIAPLRWVATVYVEFFRGIPVLLLLYLIYYGLPGVAEYLGLPVGLRLPAFAAAVVGFGLNYGAYEAEIYRAGIGSIPVGQWEAAASLGMPPGLCFRRIILPQAIRVILPPMTNDFIALFKDTSLVSVIAVSELTKQYQTLAKSSLQYAEIGLATATLYLLMSVPLGYLSRYLERRWGKGQ